MSSYNFTKTIGILDAFVKYLTDNKAPYYTSFNYSKPNLTINTSQALLNTELFTLTSLVTNYTDPAYFLTFANTISMPLLSPYTNDASLLPSSIVGGINSKILQTFIFTNQNTTDQFLDGIKTVFEFTTPNVQNFINNTTGNITFQVYDNTRNYVILSQNIDISNVLTHWNTLASTGSTIASTCFQSGYFNGLMPQTTNYDCIWQLRMNTSDEVNNNSNYYVRINGLQYLFYNKEVPL